MNEFEKIRTNNRLLYEYVRGSILYGINVSTSDVDTSGIFMGEPQTYLGLKLGYKDYVADAKGDNSWYELLKWVYGLTTSNPTMLESLFIPEDKVLYNNGMLQPFFENKDKFLTKACFNPILGYCISQIQKARGLNKKIVNPITERKTVLDFCFTSFRQGSTNIQNWLDYRGLKQEYCGLSSRPNMPCIYGVYYDFGRHIAEVYGDSVGFFKAIDKERDTIYELVSNYTKDTQLKDYSDTARFALYLCNVNIAALGLRYEVIQEDVLFKPSIGYHGIVSIEKDSNEVRLSSLPKDAFWICDITYNENGYRQHCIKYKEYKQWEKERNPARYESNLEKNYDSKNLCHCFRILAMGQEILEGKGMILDRREAGDAQFLIDIRNHKFEYDELMVELERRKTLIDETLKNCTLPDKIDLQFVDDLVKDVQLTQIKKIYF